LGSPFGNINIKVDRVPDERVDLAKDGDYTKGVELGKLKQFAGDVFIGKVESLATFYLKV
jgi:hypothetical protein